MRFSSIFQPAPPAPRQPQVPDPARPQPAEDQKAAAPVDLPDDLDARVRLIGEWQLLEG